MGDLIEYHLDDAQLCEFQERGVRVFSPSSECRRILREFGPSSMCGPCRSVARRALGAA